MSEVWCDDEKRGSMMAECCPRSCGLCPEVPDEPEVLPSPEEFEYVGCYRDDADRDLKFGPGPFEEGYTPITCREACSDYQYFSL